MSDESSRSRITTIRVPQDLYDDLTAVARADGEAVSVVIRRAIALRLAERMTDPEFQTRAADMIARDQARIADPPAGTGERLTDAERERLHAWFTEHRPADGWNASAQAWMDLFAAVEAILSARTAALAARLDKVRELADEWLQYARDAAELKQDQPLMTWAAAAQRLRAALADPGATGEGAAG